MGAALFLLFTEPNEAAGMLTAAIAFVALLAAFPIYIPHTKYPLSVADVFLFALLALHDVAAAVVTAGIEGGIGACRSSHRLTSRLSTPAAAMATMAVTGTCLATLHRLLRATPLGYSAGLLVALSLIALPYFAGVTLPLIAVLAATNGQRVSLRDWRDQYGWLGALYLVSAGVVAVLAMNARQFGPAVLAASAVVALVVLALVRTTLRHNEREHAAQEARIGAARREAELNQRRFPAAFTHAAIGMAIVRLDGRIHQVNRALSALLGRDDAQLVGQPLVHLLHAADVRLLERHAHDTGGDPSVAHSLELRCWHARRAEIWVAMHCSSFVDPAQERPGMIYQRHDITSRRQVEGQLHHIAYHDGLTDLANRNCFHERLPAYVRPDDLVARLGGDEFAVLLDQVSDAADGARLTQRLLDELSRSLAINGTEITPSAGAGMTFSDLGFRTADEMLRDADLAMYEAKAAGRGQVVVFDQSRRDRVAQRLALEKDLRHAIGDGRLSLNFQPIYQLDGHCLAGFEALVRWEDPVRGVVSPAVFVTLAEESGLIESLTDWVLDQAVAHLASWRRRSPELANLTVNVNISGRDLVRSDLADTT